MCHHQQPPSPPGGKEEPGLALATSIVATATLASLAMRNSFGRRVLRADVKLGRTAMPTMLSAVLEK